ncbi:phosphatase PAP2 family protein [Lacibacter sediminis]|uniref:Vanadium-dependent haloperoxidase n=1 Tax=Lacibacter sediminis TaxID=2760713 RepID=A0A7G5XEW1_9BACT|nr:hypothetical protein [Lacibacter sediminis]QNA44014.1 hypothetical protein H4075_18350 [Lacibacter sediminis]
MQKKLDPINILPFAKKYDAGIPTAWFSLLADLSKNTPFPPPQIARILSYSGIALYESVVPGMPSYQSMYRYITGNSIEFSNKKEYYWPACANAAIASTASRIIKSYNANADLASIQQMEASNNAAFLKEVSAEQLQFSIEFGKYVADVIYTWSTTDGTLNANGTLAGCSPYIPLGGLGNWVPTFPGFFPAAGACQGNLRTFYSNAVNITLPPAPPVYSAEPSSDFYNAANEIYNLSLNLTVDDIRLSQAWRDIRGNYNTPAHIAKLTSQIITKEHTNLEEASVIYAKTFCSMFDAIAAVFKAKFTYSLLRPITYIRNVMGFNNWTTVIPTLQHPSYPSTSACAAASAVHVLEESFGTEYAVIDSTQNTLYGTWTYSSLDGFLQDVGKSRLVSGINFRFSVNAGINQGRQVGQLFVDLPLKKL